MLRGLREQGVAESWRGENLLDCHVPGREEAVLNAGVVVMAVIGRKLCPYIDRGRLLATIADLHLHRASPGLGDVQEYVVFCRREVANSHVSNWALHYCAAAGIDWKKQQQKWPRA
jgi:hypothetical protein